MRSALLITLLTISLNSLSQATDLIISEYVEGSSNNKYIEIYNGTTASINLGNYQLRYYANGASTPTTSVTLSGTLASGAVIVYKNASATAYGGAATNNTAVAFNGDDAIALYKTTTSSFVDIFGNIGCDPGAAWTSGSFSTVDKTLVRNPNICSGVTTDPSTSCPFPTLASEWTQYNTDDVSHLGSHTMSCVSCVVATPPAVNSSNLLATTFCTSANLSFTAGNGAKRLVVVSTASFTGTPVNGTAYNADNAFGSGDQIGAGNYVVMNSNASSVSLTGLTPATTYYVRIYEYNGTLANCEEGYLTTGTTLFTFTTQNNCATPQIRSMLVDACSTQEGLDELVIIENGNDPLSIADIKIAFPSGGTYCNSGCSSNTLLNNASYISQLNSQAGCSLFTYADPIPAGAIIVVFTGLTPSYVFDYSSQCPSSQNYYAIFCNNNSIAGRFANSGTGTRTLDITFGANSDQVTYDLSSTLGDGTFVDFDTPGNASYRQELNCIYPLAAEWGYFKGTQSADEILLFWQTIAEQNVSHFTIERAEADGNFYDLAQVSGNGTSEIPHNYTFADRQPVTGLNYYRIRETDLDGASSYSGIIAFRFEAEEQSVYYHQGMQQLIFSQELKPGTQVALFGLNGQLISKTAISETQSSVSAHLSSGIWLVRITSPNGAFTHQRITVTNE